MRQTHTAIQMNRMRQRRMTFSVAPVAPPTTTSMGYDVATTFTIHESEPIDGAIQYELLVDGKSVWVGMGDSRVDGLLAVIAKITDQEPDVPNN